MLTGTHLVRFIWLLPLLVFAGCGGGGGGTTPPPPPPPTPSFTLQVQPATITVAPGYSATVIVKVVRSNGFSSSVSVAVSGGNADVTASPSSFDLATGEEQVVNIAVSADAPSSEQQFSFQGTSGSLQRSAAITASVHRPSSETHPPLRARFLRTDAQHDYAWVQFFPQVITLYHQPSRRFFMSSTYRNRLDVFDAVTETQVGHIDVPGAWTLDESPDHKTIYAGTQVGDIYFIDPLTMKVKKRVQAAEIGPVGFAAYEVKALADGTFALLGGQGGIPAVDGYSYLAIWNPETNDLRVYGGSSGPYTGPVRNNLPVGYIGQFALTADRKKIVISHTLTPGSFSLIDPVTETYNTVGFNDFVDQIWIPSDGSSIVVMTEGNINLYHPEKLYLLNKYEAPCKWCTLSFDGKTLYAGGRATLMAYDLRTGAYKGWTPSVSTDDLIDGIVPQAVDETGLIAGLIGRGIAFADGAKLRSGSPALQVPNNSSSPAFGPASGGTTTTLSSAFTPSQIDKVYFGSTVVTNFASATGGVSVITPPHQPGAVDSVVVSKTGNIELAPEGFTFGPSIVQVVPNAAIAEGGGKGVIYGYGFGPIYGSKPSDLSVTVGGVSAPITSYSGQPPDPAWFPFPLQYLEFIVPPGVPGTTVDVSVSNSSGTGTASAAFEYLPSPDRFPLPGALLTQGIYDSHRDLYYFADAAKIQVFSAAQRKWLAPIAVPGAERLWGIALSPDGKKLAVADAGAQRLYALDPQTPTSIKSFSIITSTLNESSRPGGVAITDAGVIYYTTFNPFYTGGYGFHRLNTSSGSFADFRDVCECANDSDAYARLILSPDNTRIFLSDIIIWSFDISSEKLYVNPNFWGFDYDLAVASNQTWMTANAYLMDTNLNPQSFFAYNEREVANVYGVYGQKLSPDGNLLFQPLESAIDVLDGKIGTLRTRISLPFDLSANYDALVSNGKDNVLVAITGESGDGIAFIDLTQLPEPLPQTYQPSASTGLTSPSQLSSLVVPASAKRQRAVPDPTFRKHVIPAIYSKSGPKRSLRHKVKNFR